MLGLGIYQHLAIYVCQRKIIWFCLGHGKPLVGVEDKSRLMVAAFYEDTKRKSSIHNLSNLHTMRHSLAVGYFYLINKNIVQLSLFCGANSNFVPCLFLHFSAAMVYGILGPTNWRTLILGPLLDQFYRFCWKLRSQTFVATCNISASNIYRTKLDFKLKEYQSALEVRKDKNLTRINVHSENALVAKLVCCGGMRQSILPVSNHNLRIAYTEPNRDC